MDINRIKTLIDYKMEELSEASGYGEAGVGWGDQGSIVQEINDATGAGISWEQIKEFAIGLGWEIDERDDGFAVWSLK
jgi:hypothetical protein